MKRFALLAAFLVFLAPSADAADPSANSNINYDQVREDYRTYLRELKKLGGQYKQFTGEMKKIMQEEGFPQWDEEAGLGVAPPGSLTDNGYSGAGYRITDEGKNMNVSLDLPGLRKESIKVTIQGEKFLHVSGMRKIEGRGVDHTIELPFPAEDKNARAVYEDGVLTVTLRKTAPSIQEINVPVR